MVNNFLIFWGLRKPPAQPTQLDLYRDEWRDLLGKLAIARLEERTAGQKVEAFANRIDLIEALISTYPAQQARLLSAYSKATEFQHAKDY